MQTNLELNWNDNLLTMGRGVGERETEMEKVEKFLSQNLKGKIKWGNRKYAEKIYLRSV